MPNNINRQWRLAERPTAMVMPRHFEYHEAPIPELGAGAVLVRSLYLSFDPAQRVWLDDRPSYVPPVAIGEVMRASSVGQVVKSEHQGFVAGDLVIGSGGWQDYYLAQPDAPRAPGAGIDLLPKDAPPTLALSVLGVTGLTAYFGLLKVGRPEPGQTVVVSGAAGATGSVVGQIARIKGCRVIGIAGGPEKCKWLCEQARFDAAIDYRNENLAKRLRELCPDGIHVHFENVGGAILEAALSRLATNARVVFCGALSGYNATKPVPGPRNLANLIVRRASIEGFIVFDYAKAYDQARRELHEWIKQGQLLHQEDIQSGFKNIPKTLQRLYKGQNIGKQLLKLADPV